MSARSKTKKRYGDGHTGHEASAKNLLRAVRHHVDVAIHEYEKGNCLGAGTAIDNAWFAEGKARSHIESMEHGGAGSDVSQSYDRHQQDIEWIDSKFEKTCVRKKPTK